MNPRDREHFLKVRLPGRLKAEDAAIELGCEAHDIPVLVKRGLLKPLGTPRHNAVKYFFANDILEKANDLKWLTRATNAIYEFWRNRPDRQKTRN